MGTGRKNTLENPGPKVLAPALNIENGAIRIVERLCRVKNHLTNSLPRQWKLTCFKDGGGF